MNVADPTPGIPLLRWWQTFRGWSHESELVDEFVPAKFAEGATGCVVQAPQLAHLIRQGQHVRQRQRGVHQVEGADLGFRRRLTLPDVRQLVKAHPEPPCVESPDVNLLAEGVRRG